MSGTIPKEEFKEKLDSGEYILIDVRSQFEHNKEKITESEVIDIIQPEFLDKINQLDKNKKYLVYCQSGGRSNQAFGLMIKEGFAEVYDLKGGFANYY